ncbi:hypothetical protein AeNC1_011409 [Aphanomyces euteiches]|nr:hypothetical protein AeNC1_011409 [Aphanomyces euteiches]
MENCQWWHDRFGTEAAPCSAVAHELLHTEQMWPFPEFYEIDQEDLTTILEACNDNKSIMSLDDWGDFLMRYGPLEECFVHIIREIHGEEDIQHEDSLSLDELSMDASEMSMFTRRVYRGVRLPPSKNQTTNRLQAPTPEASIAKVRLEHLKQLERFKHLTSPATILYHEQSKEGLAWWYRTFTAKSIPTKQVVDKLLTWSVIRKPRSVSTEIIATYLQVFFGSKDNITLSDWELFLLRFGPAETSIETAVFCLQQNDGYLAPWFHGVLTRDQVSALLQDAEDGAFLVRFSQKHMKMFTLSYVKQDERGRRVKHVLLGYKPNDGFRAQDGGSGLAYTSIVALIADSERLVTPIVSKLSVATNAKLRDIHAAQAQNVAVYDTFGDYAQLMT